MAASTERERQWNAEGEGLRRLARGLLGRGADGGDADDLLQSTFAAALASPRRDAGERPWLRTTMRNLALLWRRTAARRHARERVAAAPEQQSACDPAAIAMQSELLRDVAAAVHDLAEPYRSVMVLRFWQGLLPAAIAVRLGVPRNTVRTRLQRGLAMLRTQLDAKYGMRERWAAPLGVLVGARAAVTGGGVLLFAGMLMKTKLLLGAAALLLAAVAIPWSFASAPADPPRAPGTASTKPVAANVPAPEPVTRQAIPPIAMPHDAPPAIELAPEPVATAPWICELQVVDEDEHPMADAEITIWAATASVPAADGGQPRPGYSGHDAAPRLRLRSDRQGRAVASLDFAAAIAMAELPGAGQSRQRLLQNAAPGAVTKLVLEPWIELHGRVVEDDGDATVGADVTVRCSPSTAFLDLGVPSRPEPATTDEHGAFRVPVMRYVTYELRARSGARETFATSICVSDAVPPDVTLRFPGSFTLGGVVVDAGGAEVAGARVTAWRQLDADEHRSAGGERVSGTTDAHGRFELMVRRCAGYQLLAAADGHANSAVVMTETTAPRPHAEARLVLQRFADIAGHVLRSDGTALPGIKVIARPEAGDPSPRDDIPNQEDLFARVAAATSADDGSFRLRVAPGCTWTLSARLAPTNWRMAVHRAGVAPGSTDVLMMVSDEDLAGCVVRGTVHRRDGLPLGECRIEVVDHDAEGRPTTRGVVAATFQGANFVCPPLPRNQTFGLRVTMLDATQPQPREPLAPAVVETFSTDRDARHFDLWLEAWGQLPVQVLEADSSPARHIQVYLQRNVQTGSDHVVATVDANGKVLVEHCVPGPHHVFASRDSITLIDQPVVVTGGRNDELVLHLPPPHGGGR